MPPPRNLIALRINPPGKIGIEKTRNREISPGFQNTFTQNYILPTDPKNKHFVGKLTKKIKKKLRVFRREFNNAPKTLKTRKET